MPPGDLENWLENWRPKAAAKRIVYSGPSPEQFGRLLRALAPFDGPPGEGPEPRGPTSVGRSPARGDRFDRTDRAQWIACHDHDQVLDELGRSYVNLVVLDLRCEPAQLAERSAGALALLDALDQRGELREDLEERYAFHRVLVLLAGGPVAELDELVLQLGARGVGRVVREAAGTSEAAFALKVHQVSLEMMAGRPAGKRALCSSGGGISGLFFELGALKCLDDCLPGLEGVGGFDMFFGISAGAVVSGPLAVGYSVDEFMAAVAGVGGGRMPPLDLRLFRLGHLNWGGLLRRTASAARTTLEALGSALRGHPPSLESLLFEYADLVAPPFSATRFEQMIRRLMEAAGASNDFRRLPRPLFVGATDQDQRRHVLFGDEDHRDVPISLAIQASLSINPAFSATRIGGRYYEDGAVTRTSNFVEAIRRGATLIIVLDPFVPFIARNPGFADRRGVLYNLDQDVRTVSYTRYENTRSWVLRHHPEVSAYTFVPANRLRRLMSIRPMDHRPFLEIWRGAYLSTLHRIQRVRHRFVGDLAAHGMRVELARAEAVAERLERTPAPAFADFFPDGRVAIKRPPMILDRTLPARARASLDPLPLTA